MPRLYGSALLAVALCAVACEPPPTEDLLSITYGTGEFAPPVRVDVACETGGCDGLEFLEVELTFEDHDLLPTTAEVEILQYRVDYFLPALGTEVTDTEATNGEGEPLEVPYYAGTTSQVVPIDETVTFVVRAAGQVQREWVRAQVGTSQIDGIGTLTLAGYDHRNATVEVSEDFDISFGDFVEGDPQ